MSYALQRFDEGDILRFPGPLNHFAIYAGEDQIIHYQKRVGVIQVIEESIQDYWKHIDEDGGTILFGNKKKLYPEKYTLKIVDRTIAHQIFSGPETVQRARSMVNKEGYNLLINNCEHFVTWCKYGMKAANTLEKAAMGVSAPMTAGAGGFAGAVGGAAVGSVVPVVGTAIGALIGGIGGAVAGAVAGPAGTWVLSKLFRRATAEKGDGKW